MGQIDHLHLNTQWPKKSVLISSFLVFFLLTEWVSNWLNELFFGLITLTNKVAFYRYKNFLSRFSEPEMILFQQVPPSPFFYKRRVFFVEICSLVLSSQKLELTISACAALPLWSLWSGPLSGAQISITLAAIVWDHTALSAFVVSMVPLPLDSTQVYHQAE